MNLYIISDGDNIKIGVSENVRARISTMQVNNANKLTLLYQLNCGSNEYAYKLEAILHKRYAKTKVSGEWFKISPALIKMDLDLMQAGAEIFSFGVGYATAEEKVLSGMTKEQILEYLGGRWPATKFVEIIEEAPVQRNILSAPPVPRPLPVFVRPSMPLKQEDLDQDLATMRRIQRERKK